jgi:hypothetical protein
VPQADTHVILQAAIPFWPWAGLAGVAGASFLREAGSTAGVTCSVSECSQSFIRSQIKSEKMDNDGHF